MRLLDTPVQAMCTSIAQEYVPALANRMRIAHVCAGKTAVAKHFVEQQLFFHGEGLGVVTPLAAKRTALEKYRGTDAVAVVDLKRLYGEDHLSSPLH